MIADFDCADLADQVSAMDVRERAAPPFGVIRLDGDGLARIYNRTVAEQSGYKYRPVVGLDFFEEATPDMRGRGEQATGRGSVESEIGGIGEFNDPEDEIRIRVMSAFEGGLWLFMNRASL